MKKRKMKKRSKTKTHGIEGRSEGEKERMRE